MILHPCHSIGTKDVEIEKPRLISSLSKSLTVFPSLTLPRRLVSSSMRLRLLRKLPRRLLRRLTRRPPLLPLRRPRMLSAKQLRLLPPRNVLRRTPNAKLRRLRLLRDRSRSGGLVERNPSHRDAPRPDHTVEQLVEVVRHLLRALARPDVQRLRGALRLLQ